MSKENPYDDFKISDLGDRLARLQRVAQAMDIPILVIIEGFESSGRGRLIRHLVQNQNPKYYDVQVFDYPKDPKGTSPLMKPFWLHSPKKGDLQIFDRSYYFDFFNDLKMSQEEEEERVQTYEAFEKALYDDYTVVVKFFLNISWEGQEENIDAYLDCHRRSIYVDCLDSQQNKNYEAYRSRFARLINRTNFAFAPWYVLDADQGKDSSRQALGILLEEVQRGIERVAVKREEGVRIKRSYKPQAFRPLDQVNMDLALSPEDYDKKKGPLQEAVADLAMAYYENHIPIVLVFEGVDAAGKDGAIKRLIKKVDPRLKKTHAISAPDETEKAHHYLWRFFRRLPEDGTMAIFSRSWYGRVMVERVEGFATDNEWERAYGEMLEMERQLYKKGYLVLKFFLTIDKDEQLRRFEDRENDPDKQYKITEEDWRNRDKWDAYMDAMNEMLERTDTDFAPWIIVPGNNKPYARIRVMEEFLKYGKSHLDQVLKKEVLY
ncbi:MAG: hypothetical protein Q4E37_03810 [Tissierellia bacterium]|nr:hypothetical protein [Tissierellia bacterium]